jgi:hypothetical protein
MRQHNPSSSLFEPMLDVSRDKALGCYHYGHVDSTNLGPSVLCAKREIRIRLRIARRGFTRT